MTRRPADAFPPIAEGWAAHPYAPRSTEQTLVAMSYRRLRVPPGTTATTCPFCDRPMYCVPGDPNLVCGDGTVVHDPGYRVDCEPDVAGVVPTAEAWGSGISHSYVCGVPRPLPLKADASSATMPDRTASKRRNRR